jgi:IS30 family transposase
LNRSAIGTLVERSTRFTMLLHLPPMDGHGTTPRAKNGPALAGHGAEAVRDAITTTIITLPARLRRSLTWDQGAEMASHAQLRIDTGIEVYFCDPHSPWQRGTNENTNGLLRQYFPPRHRPQPPQPHDLAAVAAALNGRPRKTLGWKTPAEALNEFLYSAQQRGVATTPEPGFAALIGVHDHPGRLAAAHGDGHGQRAVDRRSVMVLREGESHDPARGRVHY